MVGALDPILWQFVANIWVAKDLAANANMNIFKNVDNKSTSSYASSCKIIKKKALASYSLRLHIVKYQIS